MKNRFLLLVFLFSPFFLSAQQRFISATDSLWLVSNMPFPVVSLEFNFVFNADMLCLDGAKSSITTNKEPEVLPKSLDSLVEYFNFYPTSSEAALQIFLMRQQNGEGAEAEPYLKTAIELKVDKGIEDENTDELQAAIGLMLSYYGMQPYEEVLRLLDVFTTKYPQNAKGWNMQALYQINKMDTLGAEKSIEKSLAIDGLSPNAYVMLMQLEVIKNIDKLGVIMDDNTTNNTLAINNYQRFVALEKKYPKSELPRLARKTVELIEIFSTVLLQLSGELEPLPNSKPLKVNANETQKIRLLELQKYYLGLIKNKKNKQTYLPYKALMLVEMLLDNGVKADEYYEKIRESDFAKTDISMYKLSALHLFLARDYKGFCKRMEPVMEKDYNLANAMLYARMQYVAKDKWGALAALKKIVDSPFSNSSSKPTMGLVFFALKEGKKTEAFDYLQSIANLTAEHPKRDEDFYFYVSLGLILDGNAPQAQGLLENLRDNSRDYRNHSKKYLDYFFRD